MSQEEFKVFFGKLAQDENFRDRFFAIKDNETLRGMLAENGLPTEPEPFIQAVFQTQAFPLPDEALAGVSGGLTDKYDFKNETGFISFVGGVGKWVLNNTVCKNNPIEYSDKQKEELQFWRII